jgi:hypothetical protein
MHRTRFEKRKIRQKRLLSFEQRLCRKQSFCFQSAIAGKQHQSLSRGLALVMKNHFLHSQHYLTLRTLHKSPQRPRQQPNQQQKHLWQHERDQQRCDAQAALSASLDLSLPTMHRED